MRKTVDKEKLIYALRCSNNAFESWKDCIKEKCPYFYNETEEAIAKFRAEHDPEGYFGSDFFEVCDTERIMLDAADILEAIS